MSTFNSDELCLFNMIFKIYKQRPNYIQLKSKSGQHWCVYKEDENIVVLLHKHHSSDSFHIHYICETTSQCLSELLQHERYIEKRKKLHQKICGNRKLEIIL